MSEVHKSHFTKCKWTTNVNSKGEQGQMKGLFVCSFYAVTFDTITMGYFFFLNVADTSGRKEKAAGECMEGWVNSKREGLWG